MALWNHKTFLMKRILCLAKPAEKPFDGEKLQVVCGICDIWCFMSGLEHREGDVGPIWLTVTHSFAFVCALLSHICND